MTINRDAEENVRKSVKKIEERLKFYEKNYAIKDRQDLLAMCLIEIATKLESVNERAIAFEAASKQASAAKHISVRRISPSVDGIPKSTISPFHSEMGAYLKISSAII